MEEQVKYFPNHETGDAYAYLDIKRETNFFVAFAVGKWIQPTCDEFYHTIAKRTAQPDYKHRISFCTDGNDQSINAIPKHFHKDSVRYGRVIKDKCGQMVIGAHQEKVFGNMDYSDISINNVDGFCSKLRARAGCFVRKTRNFAKRRKHINNVLHITQTNHNFINDNEKETPAMREGLLKRKLEWHDIFNVRTSFII